ncbi:hypothetical protein L2E82_13704 [Cichorium intybus]|uniref:Uncharacterized protein n=1 Tax=Cichorium intybus TaxID=13427 RepID=A0ACB9EY09_CICIN|nr:hypothetical protein L2E82_13704 [Cichorium intybus]
MPYAAVNRYILGRQKNSMPSRKHTERMHGLVKVIEDITVDRFSCLSVEFWRDFKRAPNMMLEFIYTDENMRQRSEGVGVESLVRKTEAGRIEAGSGRYEFDTAEFGKIEKLSGFMKKVDKIISELIPTAEVAKRDPTGEFGGTFTSLKDAIGNLLYSMGEKSVLCIAALVDIRLRDSLINNVFTYDNVLTTAKDHLDQVYLAWKEVDAQLAKYIQDETSQQCAGSSNDRWKINKDNYPCLTDLAQDFLCIVGSCHSGRALFTGHMDDVQLHRYKITYSEAKLCWAGRWNG